ncbi:MAG: hypothetical protein ABW252_23500 [Polyangiales bacterium]
MNAKKWGRGLLVVPMCALMALSGCSDDDDDDFVADAGDGGAVRPDGGMDASTGDASYADFNIKPTAISATGHDRFFGVTYDEQGNIFAVGQTATGTATTDDTSVVVAKFKPTGELDTTFGAPNGYKIHNLNVGGQNVETARGIVVIKSGANAGKIVIAGEADRPGVGLDAGVTSRDTDVVLARLLANGELDPSFGTAGVRRHDLGTGVETQLADGGVQLSGADTIWSLGQTSDGKLVLHGASRATGTFADGGARTDTDYTLVRVLETGDLDTTFATTGFVRTDVGEVNAGARAATVLADNSVVAAGYTTSTVLGQNTQQPVLYKVSPTGVPDNTFAAGGPPDALATQGVWHGYARNDQQRAEAYGAALQGDKFVTVGYGPTPTSTGGSGSDWVFFRFNANGTQDKTFGTNGETFIDVAKYGDNGRAVTVLPDNRVFAVGGGRRAPAAGVVVDAGTQPSDVDGVVVVLTPTGAPDVSFGTGGFRTLDWGNADFLHAAAVAPGKKQVAVVGAAGGGREATSDDDAVLVLWTLP